MARRIAAVLPFNEDSVRIYKPVVIPALMSPLAAVLTALGLVFQFLAMAGPQVCRA